MTDAPTVADYLWTAAIVIGFAVMAGLAIIAGNRREAELRREELDHHEETGEVPPFRILEPGPYNWTDETET